MSDNSFLAEAEAALMEPFRRLGFRITGRQESRPAKQPSLTASRGDLLLRIGMESGQGYVDFGSSAAPGDWVNSYHVMRLADPEGDRFGALSNRQELYGRLIKFLEMHANSLETWFQREKYRDTRNRLRSLQDLWLKEKGWK